VGGECGQRGAGWQGRPVGTPCCLAAHLHLPALCTHEANPKQAPSHLLTYLRLCGLAVAPRLDLRQGGRRAGRQHRQREWQVCGWGSLVQRCWFIGQCPVCKLLVNGNGGTGPHICTTLAYPAHSCSCHTADTTSATAGTCPGPWKLPWFLPASPAPRRAAGSPHRPQTPCSGPRCPRWAPAWWGPQHSP